MFSVRIRNPETLALVEDAVLSVREWGDGVYPMPTLTTGRLDVPRIPEVVGRLAGELLLAGLVSLACRVGRR